MPYLISPASVAPLESPACDTLVPPVVSAQRILSLPDPVGPRAATAAPMPTKVLVRPMRTMPRVLLVPDVIRRVFVELTGVPAGCTLTTDSFRKGLPLAMTCKAYLAAYVDIVTVMDVLPCGFASPWSGPRGVSAEEYVHYMREGGSNIRVTDAMMTNFVTRLPNLTSLHLSTCVTVTDDGVMELRKVCPRLQKLVIYGNHAISDMSVKNLGSLKHLQSLDLSFCTRLTNASGAFLATYPSLTALHIRDWREISDAFIHDLFKGNASRTLVELSISRCVKLSDLSLNAIVSAIGEKLEVLRVKGCLLMSDAGMAVVFSHCGTLKEVNFGQIPSLTSASTSLVGGMPSLRILRACEAENLNDFAVAQIAASETIVEIDFNGCSPNASDAAAWALSHCLSLRKINMAGWARLTDSGVRSLAALPNLDTIVLAF